MKEYDIDELVSNIDFSINSFNDYGNGILLTNGEVVVLDKYKIDYRNCSNLGELIYKIEDYLGSEDYDLEDLESVSLSVSERNYYYYTNK